MSGSRREVKFEFETIEVNLQDTILIPMQVGRDTPLEDMDLMDFGLVRYSDLFPLRYAGYIPMRFLQGWDDDSMYFENWAHGDPNKPEVITMEDIYSTIAELDAGVSAAQLTRADHARMMEHITKLRDFVAYVANEERKLKGDDKAAEDITAGKEKIGVQRK